MKVQRVFFSLLIINAKEKEITIGRRPRPRKK